MIFIIRLTSLLKFVLFVRELWKRAIGLGSARNRVRDLSFNAPAGAQTHYERT